MFNKNITEKKKKNMKKIIDGRMYNTETAKVIAYNSNNLPKSELEYCMETLYRKRNGEYFLHGDGGAYSPYNRCVQGHLCGDEKIIPLCEEEAKEWCEENLDADEYIKIWGEVEE